MNKEDKWFTIPGTAVKIPIMDIKGKDYLQVAHRLVWFNIEKPEWSIETEVELDTPEWIRVKCTIKDPSGRIMRTARKSKRLTQDKDADSCETGAIGRCLGLLGYGTQYAGDDLDEGDVVDAPQSLKVSTADPKRDMGIPGSKVTFDPSLTEATVTEDLSPDFWEPKTEAVKKNTTITGTKTIKSPSGDPGEYKMTIGKKFAGWKLKEIPMNDLKWWVESVEKDIKGKSKVAPEKLEFLENAKAHIGTWGVPFDEKEPLPF